MAVFFPLFTLWVLPFFEVDVLFLRWLVSLDLSIYVPVFLFCLFSAFFGIELLDVSNDISDPLLLDNSCFPTFVIEIQSYVHVN